MNIERYITTFSPHHTTFEKKYNPHDFTTTVITYNLIIQNTKLLKKITKILLKIKDFISKTNFRCLNLCKCI